MKLSEFDNHLSKFLKDLGIDYRCYKLNERNKHLEIQRFSMEANPIDGSGGIPYIECWINLSDDEIDRMLDDDQLDRILHKR